MRVFNLQDAIRHADDVTALSLSRLDGDTLPDLIFQLPKLQALEIGKSSLRKIPDRIAQLTLLERLSLRKGYIEEISPKIGQLRQLKVLDLSYNRFDAKIPGEIFSLPGLRALSLAGNGIETLPSAIGKLRRLQFLDLRHNRLKKLPRSLFDLNEINEVDLSRNRLSSLREDLANWRDLYRLDISYNRLKKLPEGIGRCEKLHSLDASYNRLSHLPESIGSCTMLRRLNAEKNRIERLPTGLSALQWLSTLNLSRNKIGRLPPGCLVIPRLEKLDLSKNALKIIPAHAIESSRLKEMDLSHNRIERIEALAKSLQKLDLSHNRLSRMAAAFTGLDQLVDLQLAYNEIGRIDLKPGSLVRLQKLELQGNPLSDSEEELLPLTELRKLSGLPRRKELLRFLAAVRRTESGIRDRRQLYRLFTGESQDAPGWPILFEALNLKLREVQLQALEWCVEKRRIDPFAHPPVEGSRLTILGNSSFSMTELGERLQSRSIEFDRRLTSETTHILLNPCPGPCPEEGILEERVILTEREASRLLGFIRLEGDIDDRKLEKLRKLLLHPREENVMLALRIMEASGPPPSLKNEILVAWKLADDPRLRRRLRRLLDFVCTPRDQKALRLPLSLRGHLTEEQLANHIEKISRRSSFDSERIARILATRREKE
ncbi:MAG: leucine-rich repeat domain-containing protein [Saprospiraceae bacterium]|nr:leucine-rich repeat domain-containing protein [Saprospiraceae bacterium]